MGEEGVQLKVPAAAQLAVQTVEAPWATVTAAPATHVPATVGVVLVVVLPSIGSVSVGRGTTQVFVGSPEQTSPAAHAPGEPSATGVFVQRPVDAQLSTVQGLPSSQTAADSQ